MQASNVLGKHYVTACESDYAIVLLLLHYHCLDIGQWQSGNELTYGCRYLAQRERTWFTAVHTCSCSQESPLPATHDLG